VVLPLDLVHAGIRRVQAKRHAIRKDLAADFGVQTA
jgi:hypothetical protein